MSRRAAYGFAVVLAFLGAAVAPAADAVAKEPAVHITAHLSDQVVAGGEPFTVTARANLSCNWSVAFGDERRRSVGRTNTAAFVAPEVEVRTRSLVRVTCIQHDPPDVPVTTSRTPPAGGELILVRVPANGHVDVPVTIVPGGQVEPPKGPGGHGGGLPDTGGPGLRSVLAGLIAIMLGSVLIRLRRRSLPASRG